MKLTIAFFTLLIATLSLQAQTVSSISTGNPGCAIIEGNIVDEGKTFTFKGATYTVKKITAGAVRVVDGDGKEQTLVTGGAPVRPSTNAATESETPDSHKTWTRDELNKLVNGKSKAEVIKLIGRPSSTQLDKYDPTEEVDVWIYTGISKDPVSGKIDRRATLRWLNWFMSGHNTVQAGDRASRAFEFEP